MSKPITISLASLRDLLLREVKSPRPVGFLALTEVAPKGGKAGLPWRGIFKLTAINAMTGVDYERSVNTQRAREEQLPPAFTAKARQWGQRISAALIQHRDAFYMATQITPGFKPRPIYMVPQVSGPKGQIRLTPVAKEVVAKWLPDDKTAEVAAAQGVIRRVCYRNYALSSLVSLSLNGQRYRIRPQ